MIFERQRLPINYNIRASGQVESDVGKMHGSAVVQKHFERGYGCCLVSKGIEALVIYQKRFINVNVHLNLVL